MKTVNKVISASPDVNILPPINVEVGCFSTRSENLKARENIDLFLYVSDAHLY